MIVADFDQAVLSPERLVARSCFEGGRAVLARLWRRDVEAAVEPPPLMAREQPPRSLLQLPLIAALPASPHTPPLDPPATP